MNRPIVARAENADGIFGTTTDKTIGDKSGLSAWQYCYFGLSSKSPTFDQS